MGHLFSDLPDFRFTRRFAGKQNGQSDYRNDSIHVDGPLNHLVLALGSVSR
jgi:hypothetical protein